jgi:hypothetical protein
MKMRFFDFEVLPNWWCCTFGDLPDNEQVDESLKNNFVVITSDDSNARDLLLKQMREPGVVVVGYNIKYYDLMIANAIYQGFSPQQIKIVNDLIIIPNCQWTTKEHIKLQPFAKKKLGGVIYQDLLDDNDGSLKEKEAILGLDILESSVDFNKEDLTEEDKADIIYYNKHDVYACMYFYLKVMKGYVKNKLLIGKKFGIPESECYMCTNANLVARALGAQRVSFLDAEKIEIDLPKKITQYCYDNLPSKVLDQVRTHTSTPTMKLFDNSVDFGNGGLHSVYSNNLYVESDDEWMLMNKDAASYYPSMLIQFECLSRCVHNPKVFKDIYDERIYLKHKPDKTQDEEDSQLANKLVLNTTFGASGNKYLALYDPYMCTRCCRVGQIFLASLACKLTRNIPGLKVIQTNTDGILIYFRRKDLPLVTEMGEEWAHISGIAMEDDVVEKIWQRDVNNYLLIKEGGKIKRKGLWLMDTWEKPGYFLISPLTAFVSQKAAIQYLVNGTDPVDTIFANRNLQDFAMTCKKGPTYRGVVQKTTDGTEVPMFKCNRVIATKDTKYGMLYKLKMYKGNLQYTKMPSIPEHCLPLNKDLSTYDFKEIQKQLDYMFYVQRVADLLGIDWQELKGNSLTKTDRFNYN